MVGRSDLPRHGSGHHAPQATGGKCLAISLRGLQLIANLPVQLIASHYRSKGRQLALRNQEANFTDGLNSGFHLMSSEFSDVLRADASQFVDF